MRDTCEKCFKDVEADANGCCPICGGNLAKMKTARPEEWEKPESGFELFSAKHAVIFAAALAVVLGGAHFLRGLRDGSGEKLYDGDRRVKGSDGVYTITYGPNHPGRVSGLVFDTDKRGDYEANTPPPAAGGDSPSDDPVLNNARLGAAGAAGGNLAGMQEFRRQRQEAAGRREKEDAAAKEVFVHYGLGGAAVSLVREDGLKAEAVADDVGRFSVEIPPGKYQAVLTVPGYAPYDGGPAEVRFEQQDTGITQGNVSRPYYKCVTFLNLGLKKTSQ